MIRMVIAAKTIRKLETIPAMTGMLSGKFDFVEFCSWSIVKREVGGEVACWDAPKENQKRSFIECNANFDSLWAYWKDCFHFFGEKSKFKLANVSVQKNWHLFSKESLTFKLTLLPLSWQGAFQTYHACVSRTRVFLSLCLSTGSKLVTINQNGALVFHLPKVHLPN